MKNKLLIIMTALMAIILLAILARPIPKHIEVGKSDTVTIVHYDTVYNTIIKTVEKPILRHVETIKYDTVYESKDTVIALPIEKKTYNDTIICQEDSVIVESTIVGLNPSLESLRAILKKREIHQTSEKIITKYKEKKGFYVAPNASIGYGVINRKPDIYVGIGIGYKF